MSIGRKVSKLGLIAAMSAMALPVLAQEEVPAINSGALSFSLGADVPTAYVFRGYNLENSGLIVQPYAEISTSIADGVDAYFGTWNSLHSNDETATGNSNEFWYESDIYAGVSLGLVDKVSLDVAVVGYLYPNGNFTDYWELLTTVGFDDSEYLGEWALSPYVMLGLEFATDDAADEDNIYLEIGGEWGYSLVESADYPIDLTVPIKIGMSLDDFYVNNEDGDNELFGFISVGAVASVPLSFVPTEYGTWSASAGLTGYLLNDDVSLNQGEEDTFMVVAQVGVSMEY